MQTIYHKEGGFVLIVALVILLLLSAMGFAVVRIARTDLQIAGNDRWLKHAFYKADGGTEIGIKLLEENLACPTGFHAPSGFDSDLAADSSFLQLGGVDVFDANFAKDSDVSKIAKAAEATELKKDSSKLWYDLLPSDSYRSIRIPDDPTQHSDNGRHTNVAVFGTTNLAEGSAIQMSAGYHGMGYSSAAGGAVKKMDILARYDGVINTVSRILLEYTHLIGTEGECKY